jgi:cell division transport system permease protein
MVKKMRSNLPVSKPNYVYAIVSVALALFLFGSFGLLLGHAGQLLRFYREQVALILELKSTATPEDAASVQKALENTPYVVPGSIRYINKADAKAMMAETFGKDFLALDLPNPFFDVLTFNVRSNYMNPESLAQIRAAWRADASVNDVFYQENLLDAIARNLRKAGIVILSLALIFALVVGILVHNTVRLALYANRFLIKTMELVGASWGFISRPYLVRAIFHGFLSACIANAALFATLSAIRARLPELAQFADIQQLSLVFGLQFLLGIGINTLSTWVVVNKYLSMRMDDLY